MSPPSKRPPATLIVSPGEETFVEAPEPGNSSGWIGRRIAGCRIMRQLGAGGMGVVYLAEQAHPRRLVAIKTLHTGLDTPELLARFELEAEILGRMRHPGIAQVFATGHVRHGDSDVPYIVMEFIEGKQLLEHVVDLPMRARVELLATITDAVEHAHLRGVIHRDLKPANILVQSDGQPKVLDFGVARLSDQDSNSRELTTAGMILGTMAYMSPEQAGGDPDSVDLRTDVYALGMIGYRLISGRLPYSVDRGSLGEALRAICETRAPPLSQFSIDARGDLEIVIGKALEKDRELRYRNAAEFADDLRRFLNDESILARRPNWWQELRRFSRRNKVLMSAAAIALCGLVLAAVVSTRFAISEQAQRLQAEASIGFLQEMLSSANPVFAQGREVSVREVMDQAALTLDAELGDAPEVRARLKLTLAETYRALGDLPRALEFFADARSAFSEAGMSGPNALAASLGEARSLYDNGKLLEARRALDQFLAQARFSAGDAPLRAMALLTRGAVLTGLQEADSALADFVSGRELLLRSSNLSCAPCGDRWQIRQSVWAMAKQAELLVGMARSDEAETLLREAMEQAQGSLGETDPDTMLVINNLALVLRDQGRGDDALALLRDAHEQRIRLLGSSHWQTLAVANNLALALQDATQGADAEALLDDSLSLARQHLDSDHPVIAQLADTLGQRRYFEGDLPQAESLLDEAYQRRLRRQGAAHPLTLQSATTLALVHAQQGNHDSAERLYRAALQGTQSRFGAEHRQTIVARSEHASFLRDQGRFEAADRDFATALDAAQRVLARGDGDLLRVLFQYSGSLQRQQRYEAAEPLSAQLMEEVGFSSNPNSLFALAAPLRHALTLTGLQRYEESEALLLDLHQRLEDGGPAQLRSMTRNSLISLYQQWNQPEQLEHWSQSDPP